MVYIFLNVSKNQFWISYMILWKDTGDIFYFNIRYIILLSYDILSEVSERTYLFYDLYISSFNVKYLIIVSWQSVQHKFGLKGKKYKQLQIVQYVSKNEQMLGILTKKGIIESR